MRNFSILILTHNEEINILRCLNALKECDDIVIIDDFSTDNTVKLAKSFKNVRIYQRKFDNFANQRNYALDNIKFKHNWILHLDADEVATSELLDECDILAKKDEKSGYYISSKLIFKNKWLKYSSGYPVYQLRFTKLGEVKFIQVGHGQRESDSLRGFGYAVHSYLHYNFSKGLREWMSKHKRYAYEEAKLELTDVKFKLSDIILMDKIKRRRFIKQFSRKLWFRPYLRFFYQYILKKGFLDGKEGFEYCKLLCWYERNIIRYKNKLLKKAKYSYC